MRDKRKKLICLILMASALTGVTSNTSVTAFSNSNSNSNRLVKLISLAGLGFLAPLGVYLTYSGYKSSLVSENFKQESGREQIILTLIIKMKNRLHKKLFRNMI